MYSTLLMCCRCNVPMCCATQNCIVFQTYNVSSSIRGSVMYMFSWQIVRTWAGKNINIGGIAEACHISIIVKCILYGIFKSKWNIYGASYMTDQFMGIQMCSRMEVGCHILNCIIYCSGPQSIWKKIVIPKSENYACFITELVPLSDTYYLVSGHGRHSPLFNSKKKKKKIRIKWSGFALNLRPYKPLSCQPFIPGVASWLHMPYSYSSSGNMHYA